MTFSVLFMGWALALVGFQTPVQAQNATEVARNSIYEKLNSITSNPQSRFANWVVPGKNGFARGTAQDQINATNLLLANEAIQIFTALTKSEDAAFAVLSQLTERQEVATRIFPQGINPPGSFMRSLAVVPVSQLRGNATSQVFNEVIGFEQLPKPEDTYYRYANPFNLGAGFQELQGSSQSYLGSISPVTDTAALKKCRYFLGWFCNTAHYTSFTIPHQMVTNPESLQISVISLIDLTKIPDDPSFAGDGKNVNTAVGYTGLNFIGRAGSLVMVYFVGIQHANESPGLFRRNVLDEGFREEFEFLKNRLQQRFKVQLR